MGLDITAYRGLRKIREITDDDVANENWDWMTQTRFYPAGFPEQFEGLAEMTLYEYDDVFGFPAGPYSYYGEWRQQLALVVGIRNLERFWANPEPGPFTELLNFSDAEGAIGPVVSAKLARDFAIHAEPAAVFASTHPASGDFCRRYQLFQRAFEFAADRGAVKFH